MTSENNSDELILDGDQLQRIVRRMAGELVEQNQGVHDLVLVGIRTRGVPLAEALAAHIRSMEGVDVERGVLDITLYRDDLSTIAPQPIVKETHIPVSIDGRTVVLCDDVLYTGRTIRAALDALIDYGRAKAVRLAVLVDRGHRELPVQADVVGHSLSTAVDDLVEVAFQATDGRDEVLLKRSAGSLR